MNDAELNALKARLKKSRYSVGSQTVEALVKRLDLAEIVCKTLGSLTFECDHKPSGWDAVDDAYIEWRKGAEKC